MIPTDITIEIRHFITFTIPSPEMASVFLIPPGVDAPREIFVATIPRDHPEYAEAIAGEPDQTFVFLVSAQ
jgi:hypothetical protein